jgi:hypothetical protein
MGELVKHRRRFGDVFVEWHLPERPECFASPILLDVDRLNGKTWAITQCAIGYGYGDYVLWIPAGFQFDGASVPLWLWWIPGMSPLGRHVWAALPHDWICEHPEVLPRVVGDAIFGHVLWQLYKTNEAERRGGWLERSKTFAMYLAVRAYAWRKGIAL